MGAILTFAVNVSASGVDISTIGVILMIAGGIGLLWSLLALGGGFGGRTVVAEPYVDEPVVAGRRRGLWRDRY